MSLWRSLLIRNFALLWSGQTISRVGDQLNRIALAWWILEKTGSAAAMSTVLIFSSVPMILFALIGGVAVDRFHRPRVMFLSDALRGIVVAVIAWLIWQNTLSLEMLLAFSAIFGIVDAFFQPAFTAAVPAIVPLTERPSANSLTTLSAEFAGIAGLQLARESSRRSNWGVWLRLTNGGRSDSIRSAMRLPVGRPTALARRSCFC